MPRGQKRKLPIPEKHNHSRDEPQSHKGVQPSAVMEELPSTSYLSEDNSQSSSATGSNSTSQGSLEASSTTSTFPSTSDTTSDEEHTGQDEEDSCSSDVSSSPENTYSDPLNSPTSWLEQFLLYKSKMKQPMMKEDMLKIIHPRHHDRLAEILKRVSEDIEAVLAVDLKEVDSTLHSYDLLSKLKLPNNGRVWDGRGLPKTGLLMTVLGVIFVKGNCAAEEDIWKFLTMMQVYAGRKHVIYGEPRKLITKDLVTMKYLEYRQVANSDPPRYEFLWGPRAHAETSKMKVLEFLAKVNHMVPTAFSLQYEVALRDEEERARATVPARPGTTLTSRHDPCPGPTASPTPPAVQDS